MSEHNLLRRHSWLMCCGLVISLTFANGSAAGLIDFSSNLLSQVTQRWGRESVPRLVVWQRLTRDYRASIQSKPESSALTQVNAFFNQIPYFQDIKHWGAVDYWASPVEMLGSFGGDCEDYSVGKYLSLKEIGIPVAKLRITYVRAIKLGEAHMVLAYYPTPDADPLILDNLLNDIRPASQRTDLEPVYGFNDDDLWVAGLSANKGGATNVRLWRELLTKLEKEQSM